MVDKGYGKAGKSWEVRSFWLLLEFHGSWVEIMRNSEKCLEMPNCLYYTVKPMYRKSVEKERRVWKSWEFYRAWIKPSEYESNFANSESVTYPSWAVGWALSFAPNLCNEKCYKGKSKWDSIYITNMIITFKAFQRRLWRTNFKALDPVKSKQRKKREISFPTESADKSRLAYSAGVILASEFSVFSWWKLYLPSMIFTVVEG